ncbi:MAG: hypothetical protein NXI01_01175 [Gammaproteobacteria bacterium]|nr:hypothetical protein [Gammaproteobacteria bacterium]
MDNQSMDNAESSWHSTYSLVTLERILALMGIHLSQDDLYEVSQTPNSPYYQLLQVPLKNIFNGILMNQATDFREYTQKMLVDYLISGAANLPPEQTQPQGVRATLEDKRVALIESGDQFDLLQFEHQTLINESQQLLIEKGKTLTQPPVLVDEEESSAILTMMQPFADRAENISQQVKSFRNQFYQDILQTRSLLQSIPEFFSSFEEDMTHREALLFDATLGEDDLK